MMSAVTIRTPSYREGGREGGRDIPYLVCVLACLCVHLDVEGQDAGVLLQAWREGGREVGR